MFDSIAFCFKLASSMSSLNSEDTDTKDKNNNRNIRIKKNKENKSNQIKDGGLYLCNEQLNSFCIPFDKYQRINEKCWPHSL